MLAGPSGCGKTSILEMIAGARRPQSGRISLGDQMLFDSHRCLFVPPGSRAIGMVFQDFLLFPHLTVQSNLEYGQRRRGSGRIRFDDVVHRLDLRDLLPRYPATLSGGQRQRTALARALLSAPQLLLMDEPLNAQDDERHDRIHSYLSTIVDELEIPLLLAAHDLGAVGDSCDVLRVENGRVVIS